MQANDFSSLIARVEAFLDRAEGFLPEHYKDDDLDGAIAFRWRKHGSRGHLQAVRNPHQIRLEDLQGIDRQKETLEQNTAQFVQRKPANNALLWGSRGTGKSSLIKALLNAYHDRGLRVIEVEKDDLIDLPDIVDRIEGRDERFVIFSDDLSFEAGDASYKALKAILDGSLHQPPDNVLIYATSNRRHLLPEHMRDNLDARHVDGEIHESEAVEEKVSLSERFGIWLSFYPFRQDGYLDIVGHWLQTMGCGDDPDAFRAEALEWALRRGSRSGRSAYQFARDYVGRRG
ncbi:MAG: ATP-binding protein [Gammaproteobacteria bacterium]|nr:ATP-binding protein [Gammaproteobacteria bacterium]